MTITIPETFSHPADGTQLLANGVITPFEIDVGTFLKPNGLAVTIP